MCRLCEYRTRMWFKMKLLHHIFHNKSHTFYVMLIHTHTLSFLPSLPSSSLFASRSALKILQLLEWRYLVVGGGGMGLQSRAARCHQNLWHFLRYSASFWHFEPAALFMLYFQWYTASNGAIPKIYETEHFHRHEFPTIQHFSIATHFTTL